MEMKDEGSLDYLETVANKSSEVNVKKGYSWETPPAPIPEDQIAETLEADVAIIGGGISGLGAGARCTEKGLSVIVVEKYIGNVGGGFYGVDYPLLLNGNAHCRCLVQAREATDTILEDN